MPLLLLCYQVEAGWASLLLTTFRGGWSFGSSSFYEARFSILKKSRSRAGHRFDELKKFTIKLATGPITSLPWRQFYRLQCCSRYRDFLWKEANFFLSDPVTNKQAQWHTKLAIISKQLCNYLSTTLPYIYWIIWLLELLPHKRKTNQSPCCTRLLLDFTSNQLCDEVLNFPEHSTDCFWNLCHTDEWPVILLY